MLLYGKEALGAREYGNIIGYLVAVASVVVGTVTKEMIVMVMVSGFQTFNFFTGIQSIHRNVMFLKTVNY